MCSVAGNLFCVFKSVSLLPKDWFPMQSTRSVKTDLVAETLAGNNGNFITDALVRLKVEGELGVVALDDDLGGFLDRLCPYATHDCG